MNDDGERKNSKQYALMNGPDTQQHKTYQYGSIVTKLIFMPQKIEEEETN